MQQRTIQLLSISLFAAFLLWGGISLLSYVGVPVHGVVLLSEGAQRMASAACPNDSLLCRGMAGLFPALWQSTAWGAPFFAFALLSLIAYGVFLGWRALRTGEWGLRVNVRLWMLPVLFLGMAWLLLTTLSLGANHGTPVRMLIEPTAQVYPGVDAQTMESLRDNFDGLQEQGCLTYLGESQAGFQIHQLTASCMQMSFFTRVVPQFFFQLLLFFEFLVIGRFILWLLRIRPRGLLADATLSAAVGACAWIVILWFLAVFSLYRMQAGWALLVAVPLLLFPFSRHWFRRLFLEAHEWHVSWRGWTVFLGWLLLSYLALNFLTVVRPFPIGWDDLGSYLNRPRLLVSYGTFIFSMSSFQWEYLTSLGFLLFGYDSIFGATASMLINWNAGLLAVLVAYLFARTFLAAGRPAAAGAGLLSALFYYSLPLVGHFSYADMKIDNAVFMAGSLAMFCVFRFLFLPDEDEDSGASALGRVPLPRGWPWLVLGGLFAGFAFGVKVTAVMVILALLTVLLGTVHWAGLAAGLSFGFFALLFQGVINLDKILARLGVPSSGAINSFFSAPVFFVLTVVFLLVAFFRRRRMTMVALMATVLFILGAAVAVAPWILHNNYLDGRILQRPVLSAPNNLTPVINIQSAEAWSPNVRVLPQDLRLDPKSPMCVSTGGEEELDRYWGFREGWGHYLTLPWRTVMNIDSVGYYVTTSFALLLFPLLLLLPFFWTEKGRWLRWMFLATTLIVIEWMFLANGIPWYGMGMFLGLVVGLEALLRRAPDPLNRWAAGTLLALALLFNFAMRFWQFDQQRNLIEYPLGKVSAETLRQRTIPYYDDIRKTVTERHEAIPDRPYLYRVGTFIPYFIPKNLEVIGIADHQLDVFNCLYQERDPVLTVKRLKALGFNSIIFDTNTATIESDPNGSLHKKVQAFVDFLNTPSVDFEVVVSDESQGVVFVLIP
ncbi:MAG: hypothetical protein PHW10_05870 [Candidatus Peribacteraceae bacterium]|nr:hypothetical protein [Candidatus Peribacteraceae bacterium]